MATTSSLRRAGPLLLLAGLATLAGCGDRCESLCTEVSRRIEACKETDAAWAAVSWGDLEARSRADFARNCRRDWTRSSATLATHELEEALDLCGESEVALDELDCADLLDLYAPL